MDLRQLTDTVTVAPQMLPEDMPRVAALGFRMVIDNRPDAEVGPELGHEAMEAAATAAGLGFRYIPFQPGRLTSDMVEAFADALDDADGPVLAWCRSGTRSATLWAVSQAGRQSAAELIATAARAGYDLSQFEALLSMDLRA